MRGPKIMLIALPLLGGVLAGCGSGGDSGTVTKTQEQELRHPTHVPPAGYTHPQTGAPAGAPTPTHP